MIDIAIAAVAATQNGNISRRQLLELGLSRKQIAYRIKIGRLHLLCRGVYAVGRPPTDPIQWAAAAGRRGTAGGLGRQRGLRPA